MLAQLQSPYRRSSSTGGELVPTPRSPNSTALLEQDLQNINEQTQSLLADKTAAEQRYDISVHLPFIIDVHYYTG